MISFLCWIRWSLWKGWVLLSLFFYFEIILSEVINPPTAAQGRVVLRSLFGTSEACFKHSVIFYPCLIQWTRPSSSGLLSITHHNGRWINGMESNTNPIFFLLENAIWDKRKTWCKEWMTNSKKNLGILKFVGPEVQRFVRFSYSMEAGGKRSASKVLFKLIFEFGWSGSCSLVPFLKSDSCVKACLPGWLQCSTRCEKMSNRNTTWTLQL